MFTVETEQYGAYPALRFMHSEGKVDMLLVPELGGSIQELHLINPLGLEADVIEGFVQETGIESIAQNGYHSSLLFPFVNRLDGGKYNWQGQDLRFDVNEPSRGNALHGLVYNKPFKVVSQSLTAEIAICVLAPVETVNEEAYPFASAMQVTYSLHVKNGLSVKMEVTNMHSTPLPLSVGWHPYIRLTNRQACLLKLPQSEQYELGERMIPTGQTVENDKYCSFHLIDELFDDGFKINTPSGRQEICISDLARRITINCWQHAGLNGLNYFQIYTPPDRDSIAIEPLSSAANAFQNGDGLITLEPNSQVQFDFGIYLS